MPASLPFSRVERLQACILHLVCSEALKIADAYSGLLDEYCRSGNYMMPCALSGERRSFGEAHAAAEKARMNADALRRQLQDHRAGTQVLTLSDYTQTAAPVAILIQRREQTPRPPAGRASVYQEDVQAIAGCSAHPAPE